MESVREHYDRLLAKHYTWMFGKSFEEKVAEQRVILESGLKSVGLTSHKGSAVDLGSGPGYQSIALARLGFLPVIAIDTSTTLLAELRTHSGTMPIQCIQDDILHLDQHMAQQSARVIVCMGDTITHLPDRSAVLNLIRTVSKSLLPGGAFIVTYRDLSAELYGIDRFIPVHSDDGRVMTCFLEFDHPESVAVHDLVYTKEAAGWQFEKSSYRKLRLSAEWLDQAMTSAGLEVGRGTAGRLVRIAGKKQ
jgi:SAM-dependent methyltransferase